MRKMLLPLLLATLATPVFAASLHLSELPAPIAMGIANGDISISVIDGSIYSQVETNGFAAYAYQTTSGFHYLLDYDVSQDSHWSSTELSGSVFLSVALSYDLNSDGHEIDVFFDQLAPDVGSQFFFSGLPQTTVVMDASAIAAGHGVYMTSGEPDYISSGNMNFGSLFSANHPFICIECSLVFELDLIYLEYSTGLISFNFDDPRSNLITGYDSFDTTPYGWDLDINIQPVPLPGAFILFASAFFGLRFTGRRADRPVYPDNRVGR